jgi:CDP-glucose 4,6-dehydratase
MDLNFWKNKNVLITGHTGFKGSWLTQILLNAGAKITGISLDTDSNILEKSDNYLYDILDLDSKIANPYYMNIAKGRMFDAIVKKTNPEIVFHLAAQPLVLHSYNDPEFTYQTNVMGTVRLLNALRSCQNTKSVINVTTDKVYLNKEINNYAYKESDRLNGYDPYSNSKSCSELVTSSFINSFFNKKDSPAISTVRSGNVIGGGDFAKNRMVPDLAKGVKTSKIFLRNPNATRPYQHVLESLFAYILIAEKQYNNKKFADSYNVGPEDDSNVTNLELATLYTNYYDDYKIITNKNSQNNKHEANFLQLDTTKIRKTFNWEPKKTIATAIKECVDWYDLYYNDATNDELIDITNKQIKEYLELS